MRVGTKLILAASLFALAGAVRAAPVNLEHYATEVENEVDFQNLTCYQMLDLRRTLDELQDCPPTTPFADTDTVQSLLAAQTAEASRILAQRQSATPVEDDPGRRCTPAKLRPVFPLTTDVYDALGPVTRNMLSTAGVARDMDLDSDQLQGLKRSTPQNFSAGIVTRIQSNLDSAMTLRNCRIP